MRNNLLSRLALSISLAGALAFSDSVYAQNTNRAIKTNISYKTDDFRKDSDKVLLARMMFGEARNCSDEEKIAVAYVALNRANDGKDWNGRTIKEVILKPYQFSCFNSKDPNKEKLLNPQSYEPRAFDICLQLAEGVLSGKYTDPTKGATHYCNLEVEKPVWRNNMKQIGKLKTRHGLTKHDFYKEK